MTRLRLYKLLVIVISFIGYSDNLCSDSTIDNGYCDNGYSDIIGVVRGYSGLAMAGPLLS